MQKKLPVVAAFFVALCIKISYLSRTNSFIMKTTSIILSVILMSVSTVCVYSQTLVPAGPVSGTWTLEGSPYQVQGEISIATGQMLVIDAGVLVEFQGHYKFNVQGSLIAEGTLSDTIRFTINDTTGFHDINIPDGGWHGIRFAYGIPGTDSSRINYCNFTYGKAMGGTSLDKSGGGVGVYEYGDLVIANSSFMMNSAQQSGGAVAMANASIILMDNFYWFNTAINGGAITTSNSSSVIRSSFFVGNRASNSGGAIGLYLNSNCDIANNFMAANFAEFGGAIQAENNCNPMIRNNLIFSNFANQEGGGIDLEGNCQATFINNTIADNYALFGGGIDVELNTSPVFRNTILWGNIAFVNGPQIHLFSEDSDPGFYYCNIQGGIDSIGTWYGGSTYFTYTGSYSNNLDIDPVFIDQDNYYYLLAGGSPCIDAGEPGISYNDVEDPDNPGFALFPSKGTVRNDMGVYGGPFPLLMDIITAIEEPVMPGIAMQPVELFRCFPNPVAGNCHVSYSNNVTQPITIKILDINGREIVNLFNVIQDPGEYTLSFNAGSLTPGIYFCTLYAGKSQLTRMLIVEGK